MVLPWVLQTNKAGDDCAVGQSPGAATGLLQALQLEGRQAGGNKRTLSHTVRAELDEALEAMTGIEPEGGTAHRSTRLWVWQTEKGVRFYDEEDTQMLF